MLRTFLVAIPCFIIALLPGLFVTGAVAGFLWLFVYGDNSWPETANGLIVVTSLASWLMTGCLLTRQVARYAWTQTAPLHQLFAVVVVSSSLLISTLVLHQWMIGNKGHEPDTCFVQCQAKGFSASFTAYDEQGDPVCSCVD